MCACVRIYNIHCIYSCERARARRLYVHNNNIHVSGRPFAQILPPREYRILPADDFRLCPFHRGRINARAPLLTVEYYYYISITAIVHLRYSYTRSIRRDHDVVLPYTRAKSLGLRTRPRRAVVPGGGGGYAILLYEGRDRIIIIPYAERSELCPCCWFMCTVTYAPASQIRKVVVAWESFPRIRRPPYSAQNRNRAIRTR